MLRCSRCAASTSSSRAPRRSCPRPRAPVRCPPPASVGGAVGSRGRWRCSSLRCPVFRRHRRGAGGDLRHPPAAPGPHRPARRAGPAPPRPALRTRQHGAAVGGGREAQHGHHRQPPVRSPSSLAGGLIVAFPEGGGGLGLRLGCARQVRVDPARPLRRERCVWRRRAPGRRARIAQSPRWQNRGGEAVPMAAVSSSSLDPRSDSLLYSRYRQPRSNTPSGVDSTQLCHVISYRQPSTCCACTTCRIFRASQPSCTHNQQPTTRQQHDVKRQKGPEEGGGRRLPVRVGGRRGLRSATLQRSQPV